MTQQLIKAIRAQNIPALLAAFDQIDDLNSVEGNSSLLDVYQEAIGTDNPKLIWVVLSHLRFEAALCMAAERNDLVLFDMIYDKLAELYDDIGHRFEYSIEYANIFHDSTLTSDDTLLHIMKKLRTDPKKDIDLLVSANLARIALLKNMLLIHDEMLDDSYYVGNLIHYAINYRSWYALDLILKKSRAVIDIDELLRETYDPVAKGILRSNR
jgi:hypothetical protein